MPNNSSASSTREKRTTTRGSNRFSPTRATSTEAKGKAKNTCSAQVPKAGQVFPPYKRRKASAAAVTVVEPEFPGFYRPPVYSNQRIAVWLPSNPPQVDATVSSPVLLLRYKRAMVQSWQPNTLAAMGAGLGKYHYICDLLELEEGSRAPVRSDVFLQILVELVGEGSESSLRGVYAAVKGWHECNRLPFRIDESPLQKIYRAARIKAPFTRPKRAPVTVDTLSKIFAFLSPEDPIDVAVRACAAVMLWSVARSGELTVATESGFDPLKIVRPVHVRLDADRHGNEVTVITLPWSKIAHFDGEDIIFAEQEGTINPKEALRVHLQVNAPAEDEHLFAFTDAKGRRLPLSKARFIGKIAAAAQAAGINAPNGHSFRIGGTLEYLLRGASFEVVKSIGRWSSDAFRLYLREHARVLAPYVQKSLNLDKSIAEIVIPTARGTRT